MPKLESGRYEAHTHKNVTVWPKADPDGDGDPVLVDELDGAGNVAGRNILTTENGREVRNYLPPEGFVNVATREPGADRNPDNYVRDNGRGGAKRNLAGEAVGIRPGTALVEYPDGSSELLTGDYAQMLFDRAHRKVSDTTEGE